MGIEAWIDCSIRESLIYFAYVKTMPPITAQTDNTTPTLAVVFGYLGKTESDEHKAAVQAQKELAAQGKSMLIIGDGMHNLSVAEMHDALAKQKGPLDVMISAEGLTDAKNHYFISLKSDPATYFGAKNLTMVNGETLPLNSVSSAHRVLAAMPENVRSVFLGSCGSEAALADAQALSAGTRLFASSRVGEETASIPFALSVLNAATISDNNKNGTAMDEIFGHYIAADYLQVHMVSNKNGKELGTGPVRYAISGQGIINLEQEISAFKGHKFSDAAIDATVASLDSGKTYEIFRPADRQQSKAEKRTIVETVGHLIEEGASLLKKWEYQQPGVGGDDFHSMGMRHAKVGEKSLAEALVLREIEDRAAATGASVPASIRALLNEDQQINQTRADLSTHSQVPGAAISAPIGPGKVNPPEPKTPGL